MKGTRLNLDLLRRQVHPATPTPGLLAGIEDPDHIRLSRRSLLKLGGVAALGSTTVLRSAGSVVFGPFELQADKHSFEFRYAGSVRWRVDARAFAGNPLLTINRSETELAIVLKGARYAGTTIPADFECHIRSALQGWTMRFLHATAKSESSVAFEKFLLGLSQLSWTSDSSNFAAPPAMTYALRFGGSVQCGYSCDANLSIRGTKCCTVEPWDAVADRAILTAGPEETYLDAAPSRRARIEIHRDEYPWNIPLEHASNTHWQVDQHEEAFNRCVIDLAEFASGKTHAAFVFLGSEDSPPVRLYPLGEQRERCSIHLERVRYAVLCKGKQTQRSVVASFPAEAGWLHTEGLSYALGGGSHVSDFELHSQHSSLRTVRCEPSIKRVVPHLPGLISSAIVTTGADLLRFSGFGAEESHSIADAETPSVTSLSATETDAHESPSLAIGSGFDDEVYKLKAGPTKGTQIAILGSKQITVKTDVELDSVSIIRPEDLLVLRFYYDNFSLRSNGSTASLVPTNSAKTGTIVVEFQPQSIVEEAFYEADNKLANGVQTNPKTGTEYAKPAGASTSDPLPQPPIRSRMSGKSRLAFSIPKGTSIDLSLDALLKWEEWTPLLVPVAQRQDNTTTNGFHLYNGLLSYLSQQGIAFKAGSLMNKSSGDALSLSDLEDSVQPQSVSTLKSKGISYSSQYSSKSGQRMSTILRSKTSASKGSNESKSNFQVDFSYANLAAKYNGLGFALAKPHIQKPTDTETSLEIPYRLMLSPLPDGGWAHARSSQTRNLKLKHSDVNGVQKDESLDFTELWHTRLWFRMKNKDGSYSVNERDGNSLLSRKPKLRAIWSPDYQDDQHQPIENWPPWPIRSLASGDRWAIVINSSDYYTKTTNPSNGKEIDYNPKAIDSEKLFLSSIGAWIDVHGAWDPVPSNIDVVDWIHRGTMGREHYVRVMYRGYLFPFGHKCTLVKITERKFGKPETRGTYGAYMRQRMFVIVRQPEMILDDTNTLFEHEGREFPFKKVRIKTLVTPNIEKPTDPASSVGAATNSYGYPNEFYLRVDGGDFNFHCTGTDWDGNEIDFVLPMAFVLGSISNTNPAEAQKVVSYLNSASESNNRKQVLLNGARLAFGPSKTKGDTTFETKRLILNAGNPSTLPRDVTWFYPIMASADIRHQDVERMSGSTAQPNVSFVDTFLKSGFDSTANVGEAFLKLGTQVAMNFGGSGGGSSDKSGGFVSPNQEISGLSRAIGPISGLKNKVDDSIDKFTGNSFNFDPMDFLGALDAKIFGVISLFDIIQLITGSDPRTTLLPQLLSKVVPGLGDPAQLLNTLKNSIMAPINDAYSSALADATSSASSVLAKLQEMKDLIDGLQAQVSALETAISSASGTGDIFTALTTTLPEFLNWIQTNIGPLGLIPQDALNTIQEVAKVLQNMQNGIRIGFDWKPKMQADEYGFFVPQDPNDTFALSAYALLPLSNQDHTLTVGDPTAKVEGYLQNFSINLIPTVVDLVSLPIVKMGFSAEIGKKSDIFCNLGAMEWKGPLSFVNELQKFIPMDGFVDPPAIEVDMTGIKIGFDLAIPTISVGVFAITNISLGAKLTLPFLGDSMLFGFDFCKKDSPFHVTYMMLGGGGYFGMTLSLNGVDKIEAAIEIGAELALDFGVASGNISIFAGIYFCMEGDVVTLQGYVKIHGEVDVLGLISASITLEMTITFVSTGKLYGTATLTIEIHLFVFSASVDITVEKYFKGSAGDPTIVQMIPDALYPGSTQKYFELYVGAFA